jgi:hypothetical protein
MVVDFHPRQAEWVERVAVEVVMKVAHHAAMVVD